MKTALIARVTTVGLLAYAVPGTAQPIPDPVPVSPGCWEWQYEPGSEIPADAKVVPGVCETPDGRCYVVPSSACFEISGTERPLYNEERPQYEPPAAVEDPSGAPSPPPEQPPAPPPLKPGGAAPVVPVPLPSASACMPGTGWDFETFLDNVRDASNPALVKEWRGYASLDDWRGDGTPGVSPFLDFRNADLNRKAAPVYGNAVPIHRIRPPGWRPDIEPQIGGDYWRFSQPINQSGDFWIGSLDIRYSWRQHPGEDRDSWGERAVGTLTSPECTLRARYLSFRLGGSAHGSQRVELQVFKARRRQYFGIRFPGGLGDPASQGAWGYPTQFVSPTGTQYFPPPADEGGWIVVRSAMPWDHREWMQDFVFDLEPFIGQTIRIRIVDDRREECAEGSGSTCVRKEHVNADAFRFDNEPPKGVEWLKHSDGLCAGVPESGAGCSPIGRVPSSPALWGVTDVHAHPMANVSFGGHVFWGDAADPLEKVYDCSQSLTAIAGPGGRPAIAPSHRLTSCYLHGTVIAIATAPLLATCQLLNVVPFVGTGAAALCTVGVTAAAAILENTPLLTGASLHGAAKVSSGAAKIGVLLSGLSALLPDLSFFFTPGLIPEIDQFGPAAGGEANGWWERDEPYHSQVGIGRTHNAYQVDMIRRAFHGGLRLAVWDVINSRAFALAADGEMVSDWQALKDGTDAAKRIVGTQLQNIAEIAYTPEEAERIVHAGRMAVILGTEVDELGRMRPAGLPWPRSPRTASDSMEQQVADLWELGIRKVTPVHAVNNPVGAPGLFTLNYNANNFFVSGTPLDSPPTLLDLPPVKVALDGSFGSVLKDLVLGQFALLHDPVSPSSPPWNPTDWFDFDVTGARTDDVYVGEYDRITYRMGLDVFNGDSAKNAQGEWLPVGDIVGKKALLVRLLTTASLAATGPTCDLRNTTLPDHASSFGSAVDLHYTAVDAHRNALGLFRDPGGNDGEAFLRAAMKRGMLIDMDHLSQNMRVDLYKLAEQYTQEAGWPLGRCTGPDGLECGAYPYVGVHTQVRGLEIDPKSTAELRNKYGLNDERSRSAREIRHTAASGGALAVFPTGSAFIPPNTLRCTKDSDCANYRGPGSGVCMPATGQCTGIDPVISPRDFQLPGEVSNDCDFSSKTFATKYLWLLREMGGRGLTPATDLNGLISTVKPRYGRSLPWNEPCGVNERERDDSNNLTRTARDTNYDRQRPPHEHWRRIMLEAQQFESSGVWYADYAARSPLPSAVAAAWNDTRYKRVVARGAQESREDRAPRALADDIVFYNDFGPDNQKQLGHLYQMGNRPGAQMYSMRRWSTNPSRAGWDFNLDGLQHVGLYPDLFQDMRNVGVQWEQMGPLFRSASDYLATWKRAIAIGAAHP